MSEQTLTEALLRARSERDAALGQFSPIDAARVLNRRPDPKAHRACVATNFARTAEPCAHGHDWQCPHGDWYAWEVRILTAAEMIRVRVGKGESREEAEAAVLAEMFHASDPRAEEIDRRLASIESEMTAVRELLRR